MTCAWCLIGGPVQVNARDVNFGSHRRFHPTVELFSRASLRYAASMVSPALRLKFVTIAAIILSWAGSAFAHQDPRGDVHPVVRVEDGNFAIYFWCNEDRDAKQQSAYLRMVYSPAGNVLAARHRFSPSPSELAYLENYSIKVQEPAGEVVLEFPRFVRGRNPDYGLRKKGKIERHRLPWPDGVKISDLHAVLADEHTITMAAKAGTDVLSLYYFSRDHFRLPQIVEIGSPATIYDFPSASNLVRAGGRVWIAWVRPKKEKYEMVLSSWTPGGEKPVETVLDAPANWNSHLSLGVIGDVLCLAYHCSITGAYPGRSEIVTRFCPVK